MNEEYLFYEEQLKKLEVVKNQIVEFWNWQSMDVPQKNMWVGDVQELYYQLFTAWDLYKKNNQAEPGYYNSLHFTLENAKSRLKQVNSELNTVQDHHAQSLINLLMEAFEDCWKPLAIEAGYKELLSTKTLEAPRFPVKKVNDGEYQLLCASCSTVAYVFKVGKPHHAKTVRLIYKGSTHTGDVPTKYAPLIFSWLEAGRINDVHELMKEICSEEGLDAYCPDCDQIYCRGHYWLEEKWDEGFYDCTNGTCPHGHQRIVDD